MCTHRLPILSSRLHREEKTGRDRFSQASGENGSFQKIGSRDPLPHTHGASSPFASFLDCNPQNCELQSFTFDAQGYRTSRLMSKTCRVWSAATAWKTSLCRHLAHCSVLLQSKSLDPQTWSCNGQLAWSPRAWSWPQVRVLFFFFCRLRQSLAAVSNLVAGMLGVAGLVRLNPSPVPTDHVAATSSWATQSPLVTLTQLGGDSLLRIHLLMQVRPPLVRLRFQSEILRR